MRSTLKTNLGTVRASFCKTRFHRRGSTPKPDFGGTVRLQKISHAAIEEGVGSLIGPIC